MLSHMDSTQTPASPAPTILPDQIIQAQCAHCGPTDTGTMQVVGGQGLPPIDGESTDPTQALNRACLQCIADGGNCCSLAPLNRHV